MRPFIVAATIALLGLGSTAHAGRYFLNNAQQKTAKNTAAIAARQQRDEQTARQTVTAQKRAERNQRFTRQFRAPKAMTQAGMRPYSSQAPAAGTRVTRYVPRTIVPLAVLLGGSRGIGRVVSAKLFRSSRGGSGPIFGWKAKVETTWRTETGPTMFAFNRY